MAKRALKPGNKKLCGSTHQKNLVQRYECTLTHGIDYDETFALIAKMTKVRVVLAVVAARGWHLHHMNVKNMFLQGDLEEQVYMIQPLGFQTEMTKSAICQIKKSF